LFDDLAKMWPHKGAMGWYVCVTFLDSLIPQKCVGGVKTGTMKKTGYVLQSAFYLIEHNK
jgi:hypothetical protein